MARSLWRRFESRFPRTALAIRFGAAVVAWVVSGDGKEKR